VKGQREGKLGYTLRKEKKKVFEKYSTSEKLRRKKKKKKGVRHRSGGKERVGLAPRKGKKPAPRRPKVFTEEARKASKGSGMLVHAAEGSEKSLECE